MLLSCCTLTCARRRNPGFELLVPSVPKGQPSREVSSKRVVTQPLHVYHLGRMARCNRCCNLGSCFCALTVHEPNPRDVSHLECCCSFFPSLKLVCREQSSTHVGATCPTAIINVSCGNIFASRTADSSESRGELINNTEAVHVHVVRACVGVLFRPTVQNRARSCFRYTYTCEVSPALRCPGDGKLSYAYSPERAGFICSRGRHEGLFCSCIQGATTFCF